MEKKYKVNINLTRSQYCFLRDRYNKDDRTSSNLLAKIAVLEVVATQAKKELKVNNWDEEAYKVIKSLIDSEESFDCEMAIYKLARLLSIAPKELTNE